MTDILPLIKPFLPYLSQALGVILIVGVVFLKTLSREKEIISRIDKLSGDLGKLSQSIKEVYGELKNEIKEVREDLKRERERTHSLEVKLAEKYLSVDRWLEINNKFEASVKQELSRIHKSLENLNKILIEVIKDGRKAG